MFEGASKMGIKYISNALTGTLAFARFTQAFILIFFYHFVMSEVSQFLNVKMHEGTK